MGSTETKKKPFYKRLWVWVIVALFIIVAISGENEETQADEKNYVKETTEVVVKENSVSREFISALKKAETYADTMQMSKAAIYDQLISEYGEQFTLEEAQYATDNLN